MNQPRSTSASAPRKVALALTRAAARTALSRGAFSTGCSRTRRSTLSAPPGPVPEP